MFSVCSHTPPNHPKYASCTSQVMLRLLDSLPSQLIDGRPAHILCDDHSSDSWSEGPPILQWPPADESSFVEPSSVSKDREMSEKGHQTPPVVAWVDTEGGAKVRSEVIGGEEYWVSLCDDDDAPHNIKAASAYCPAYDQE